MAVQTHTRRRMGHAPTVSPSRLVAQEVRAELARQGLSARQLAEALGKPQSWIAQRIGRNPRIDLTVDQVADIADALGVPAQRLLSAWLPRLDSNQQPFGYVFPQVSVGVGCVFCQSTHPVEACPVDVVAAVARAEMRSRPHLPRFIGAGR